MKKYEITSLTTQHAGRTLHRIRALRSFCNVRAGDFGGLVESEENLSQSGNCWIADNAKVYDGARVLDNGGAYGNALVYGREGHPKGAYGTYVYEHACVYGVASKSPLYLRLEEWSVTIADTTMMVGSRLYTLEEWALFDPRIRKGYGQKTVDLWRQLKWPLFNMAQAHMAAAAEAPPEESSQEAEWK